MIDGIKAYCRSQVAYDQLLRENKRGLVFAGHVETGEVSQYRGEHEGLYVNAFEPTKEGLEPGIYLHGSLHRYLKGSNDGLFTFKNLSEAINQLAIDFHVDPSQCDLQNFEFGVNIEAKSPEALINSVMLYHGRTGTRNPDKKYFGKCWNFSQYSVKMYKKGPHLVRYELKIREMAKVREIHLNNISDLCVITKYAKLISKLYTSIDEFVFVPYDHEHKLSDKLSAIWGNYRADSYWEGLSKDQKYRARRIIKNLIEEYGLISWGDYLKKKIIEEGSKMLETSPEELYAIISALGLHAQTVAGPHGNRDRKTEEKKMETIPANRYLMVRNIWYHIDVNITAPSYSPLFPRGPPSLLSLLLLLRYAYSVALPIPVVASISLMGIVPASYRASACSMALGLTLGRPPFRPRARAAASPSIVRSRIRSRSN